MFRSFEDFKEKMRGKKVVVVGIGVSNTPLINLLIESGAAVTACDKKSEEELGSMGKAFSDSGVILKTGEGYLDNLEGDYLFRSPGIRPDLDAFLSFEEKGGVITSEMEVFFDVCPADIIAVTGSDGKTTTTTLIAEMLKASGRRVHIGGNIGNPLLCSVPDFKKDDIAVVELSSFQLMTMKKSPRIAVMTNLSPNHLDVHKSMEEYTEAKKNIMLWQKSTDKLVLNLDNEVTCAIAKEAKGEVVFFSRKAQPGGGVYLKGDMVYSDGKALCTANDIILPGIHNVENYMAAYAAVRELISEADFLKVAKNFAGVEHRIEFVREINGVKIYNDSIASSPTRARACMDAFMEKGIKIRMIAGGYDKKIPFEEMGKDVAEKVKKLYLCGQTSEKIEEAVRAVSHDFPIMKGTDFEKTVICAIEESEPGDVLVLCPACASFDLFPNFAVRGRKFKEIVNGYTPEEK